MSIDRVINQEEELRKTELTEIVDILPSPEVTFPFGDDLNAIEALDMTKVEINKGNRAEVKLPFARICPSAATTTPSDVQTEYLLLFFHRADLDNIWSSPKASLSNLTVALDNGTTTADIKDLRAHFPTSTLFWITGTNGGGQNGRIYKAPYNQSTGIISPAAVEVVKDFGLNAGRGIELNLDSNGDGLIYYTDNVQRIWSVTPSGNTTTQVKSGLSNPKDLWLSNNTVMWVALTGVGDLIKLNIFTGVVSSLVGGNTDHDWVDGHKAADIAFFRRTNNLYLRKSNIVFSNVSNTWLNTTAGAVQAPIIDPLDLKMYNIQGGTDQVLRRAYDGSNVETVGNLPVTASNWDPWCLG